MADNINVTKVRVITNGIKSEAKLGVESVDADKVKLSKDKTLADVLVNKDGSIVDVRAVNIDKTYIVENEAGEVTLNLTDKGMGIVTDVTPGGTKIVTPVSEIVGIVGDEGASNFNTKKGLAPLNHASNKDTYGIGTSSEFGHVKIASSLEEIPEGNTDGWVLGVGAVSEITDRVGGVTYISKASYESAGLTVFSDDVTYYVYDEQDLAVGLAQIKALFDKTPTLNNWNRLYPDTDGCIAHDFVNHWWGVNGYKNLVIEGSYSKWIPTKPLA